MGTLQVVDTPFAKYFEVGGQTRLWLHVACNTVLAGEAEELPEECPTCWARGRIATLDSTLDKLGEQLSSAARNMDTIELLVAAALAHAVVVKREGEEVTEAQQLARQVLAEIEAGKAGRK